MGTKAGGGTLSANDVEKHTASFFERATVDKEDVEDYLEDVCVEAIGTFCSERARATFRSDLFRCIKTAKKASLFHEITIPKEYGGTRVLETYLLASKRSPDRQQFEFLIAHYADWGKLSQTYRWLADNHDEHRIKMWLNYKLYLRIVEDEPGLRIDDE